MKFGVRKPSLKRSIKARTTGKLKRSIKRTYNPFYGKKGVGIITNPKKALYNKVYNKTTFSVFKPPSVKRTKMKTNPRKSTSVVLPNLYETIQNNSIEQATTTAVTSVENPTFPRTLYSMSMEDRQKLNYTVLKLRSNRYTVSNVKSNTMKPIMWFLILFVGILGVHWFYSGRLRRGAVYLLTAGGFGIFWIKDLVTYSISLFSPSGNIATSKDGTVEYMMPIIETSDTGVSKILVDPLYEQEVQDDMIRIARFIR